MGGGRLGPERDRGSGSLRAGGARDKVDSRSDGHFQHSEPRKEQALRLFDHVWKHPSSVMSFEGRLFFCSSRKLVDKSCN
jgi:hypothetical protein